MPLANRTLFVHDNLPVLRGLADETFDLIYLDPPFNSNHNYAAPIGSEAAGTAFKDTWTLSDIDQTWWGEIEESNQALYKALDATRYAHSKSMMAYLIYMAPRLMEMHRVLKSTGSLYLHCDDTASHYLKVMLDALFGKTNYRNQIIWQRQTARSDGRRWGRMCDSILFYSKSNRFTWHNVYKPYEADYLDKYYKYTDQRGRYSLGDLTGPNTTGGESGKPWRGIDPANAGRCWSVPRTGNYAQWIADNVIPEYLSIPTIHGRLDALYRENMISWTEGGGGGHS